MLRRSLAAVSAAALLCGLATAQAAKGGKHAVVVGVNEYARDLSELSYAENDAEEMAKRNIDTFLALDIDAVVTNVAGCGTMLKEYTEMLHDDPVYGPRAEAFVAKMKDISEFLAALPFKPPAHPLPMRVTYHEACHLCHGQQIRSQPRALLKSIPGLELIEMPESDWCCGAAGTYNLTQPEMSVRLAERKLANADSTGAAVLATGNVGCLMQLISHARETGRSLRMVHPIDLLDAAYRGEVLSSEC